VCRWLFCAYLTMVRSTRLLMDTFSKIQESRYVYKCLPPKIWPDREKSTFHSCPAALAASHPPWRRLMALWTSHG
jgi:hypothetical protein